ncbi:MAG: tryptophan--tRNA ligase, partial [Pseudomonadota bacterium]|nr:tryptophan--tRNA ligase [Pseudomonadota bacterium]
AADILLYRATHVPVGEDQKQHIELARDIAQKFNNDFNRPDFFPQPEPLIQGPATRVMSLRDGTKKMSKSDPSELARITMLDQADEIARKIRKAKTDPDALPDTVEALEARPEAANLLGIYAALADKPLAAAVDEFAGAQFSKLKEALAELATATIGPIGSEMQRLMDDPTGVDLALADGAARARDIASGVMEEVRVAVGFLQKP